MVIDEDQTAGDGVLDADGLTCLRAVGGLVRIQNT